MHGWREDIAGAARGESRPENLLYIMFAHSPRARPRAASSSAVSSSATRIATHRRPTPQATRSTTRSSNGASPITARCNASTAIANPTLVLQGDDDLMIPTRVSHLLAGLTPEAQIRIYPDAAHGFLFQYPTDVAAVINEFLATDKGS